MDCPGVDLALEALMGIALLDPPGEGVYAGVEGDAAGEAGLIPPDKLGFFFFHLRLSLRPPKPFSFFFSFSFSSCAMGTVGTVAEEDTRVGDEIAFLADLDI